MIRRIIALILLCSVSVSVLGLAACDSAQQSTVTQVTFDAAFHIIDLALDSETDQFALVPDSILLARDAFTLYKTLNANQTVPATTKPGITRVSILYNKAGVNAQDVYDLKTGKAAIRVILEGGKTFESITANLVHIDATQTHRITIVPLQDANAKVTIAATKGWQNTGIFLARGKQFTVNYVSGLWGVNRSSGLSDAAGEPKGHPSGVICNCGEPIPGYPIQAMVGKIGIRQGNQFLQVGDSFAGVSYDNNFLYLRLNQADNLLSLASGSVVVTITTYNLDN